MNDIARKVRTAKDVTIPAFFQEVGHTLKVIGIEIMIILMAMGVLYITNWTVEIHPTIHTISPIGGGK